MKILSFCKLQTEKILLGSKITVLFLIEYRATLQAVENTEVIEHCVYY